MAEQKIEFAVGLLVLFSLNKEADGKKHFGQVTKITKGRRITIWDFDEWKQVFFDQDVKEIQTLHHVKGAEHLKHMENYHDYLKTGLNVGDKVDVRLEKKWTTGTITARNAPPIKEGENIKDIVDCSFTVQTQDSKDTHQVEWTDTAILPHQTISSHAISS